MINLFLVVISDNYLEASRSAEAELEQLQLPSISLHLPVSPYISLYLPRSAEAELEQLQQRGQGAATEEVRVRVRGSG